jgi:hypothetical protein
MSDRDTRRRQSVQNLGLYSNTYSKFLVHMPFWTFLDVKYSMSGTRPDCGFCDLIASRSIFLIDSMAASCSSAGKL